MHLPALSYIFAYETNTYKLKAPATGTDPDDVCIFCREPYKKQYGDKEGCTAARLSSCGHVVGLECLEEWLMRHPDECPYYNHPIPRTTVYQMHTDPKTWYHKTLRWILFSRLGRYWDRKLSDIVCMMPGTADAFMALIQGRMNDQQLKEMEHAFNLALSHSIFLNPVLTFLMITLWAALGSIFVSILSQESAISPNEIRELYGGIFAFLIARCEPTAYLAALQAKFWAYYPVVGLAVIQIIWFSHFGLLWLVVRCLLRFARSVSGLARIEPMPTTYGE